MRLHEILNEGVVEHGNGLLAYIIVVAEEYAKLPEYDANVADRWQLLA